MTDGESLLLVVGILYAIESFVWVPAGATPFVTRWGGRWRWTAADRLWGNQQGGLLPLNPLPAFGIVAVCRETSDPVKTPLSERLTKYAGAVAWLRSWESALFLHLFLFGGYLVWGPETVWGVLLFLVGLVVLVPTVATLFFQVHRRLHPTAVAERWQRLLIMVLCPPAACRAHDVLEKRLFDGLDPLVVAKELCREDDYRDFARRYLYDRQRTNESPELWQPPAGEHDGARAFCPRCHAVYLTVEGNCRDCLNVPLKALP